MHFPCNTAATLAVNQTVTSSLIHRFSATKLLSIILVRAHLEHLGTSVGVCGVCTAILNMQLWLEFFNETLRLYGERGKGACAAPFPLISPQVLYLKAGCLLMSAAWVNSWRRCISCRNVISLGCLSVFPRRAYVKCRLCLHASCRSGQWGVDSHRGEQCFPKLGLTPFFFLNSGLHRAFWAAQSTAESGKQWAYVQALPWQILNPSVGER